MNRSWELGRKNQDIKSVLATVTELTNALVTRARSCQGLAEESASQNCLPSSWKIGRLSYGIISQQDLPNAPGPPGLV